MISEKSYIQILRASAIYDIIVITPFLTPWSYQFLMNVMSDIHVSLRLSGAFPAPDILHIFLANLLGSIVMIWSISRLLLNQTILGRLDAASRFLFAIWQVYGLMNGLSSILLAFLFFEILFGILQLLPFQPQGED